MTFKDFYDDFQEDFGNHPKRFQDTITGDSLTRAFQLTENQVSIHTGYKPEVYVDSVLQTETTDYVIDYTLGTIRFTNPPAAVTVLINAWHQKVNLTNLIKYYNRGAIKVAVQFPLIKTEEITVADVSGATASDEIKELDMEASPFNEFSVVKGIFQYKNDFRGINFLRRERYLMFDCGSGNDSSSTGLTDYGYFSSSRRSRWVQSLQYPYYIQGVKKYTVVDPDAVDPMAEVIEIPDSAKAQMLSMAALFMYQGMLHSLQNENATSLRFQKMAEVNKMIMTLGFNIKDGRWNDAQGQGHVPDHRTRFNNTNDPNA